VNSSRTALLVLVVSALVVVSFMEFTRTRVQPLFRGPSPIASASAAATGITVDNIPSADEAQALVARRLLIPVEGVDRARLRDNFAEARGGRRHDALDIMAARGTPVHAVDSGRVAKLFDSKAGGLTVYQFDRDEKYAYYYAHLDHYAEGLREGAVLNRGDILGYVGTTGNAPPNAPHLHFTIFRLGPERQWWKGAAVNPYPFLVEPAR
jgi:murein DD-endopeptidase MepM/ murein hydrolase activator NlpD